MTKQELRKIYLDKRRGLTKTQVEVRSNLIKENFFSETKLADIKVIHIFLPIQRNNEPNTWLIIEKLRIEYPQIRISVPRVNSATGSLEHVYLEITSSLKENNWGIPEIHKGELTEPGEIDTVLVPLLAFDLSGHRVGYGKGFYDKFLSRCNDATLRIGISLFEGVEQIDDIDEYDEPLHHCITPYEVHNF